MKLVRYKLSRNSEEEWEFDEVTFSRINLIVGDSGTGKTRFLNTIINFFKQIVSDKIVFDGNWSVDFEIDGKRYIYNLIVKDTGKGINEKAIYYEELINATENRILIRRDKDNFLWKDDSLPKLSKNISSLSLLKEEEEIQTIYANLRRIVARRFFGDELNQNFQFGALPPDMQKNILEKKDASALLNEPIDFHNKMNLLQKIDSAMYKSIIDQYKNAFPYIIDTTILTFSQVMKDVPLHIQAPVFCIRESKIKDWIPVNDISSGMQKIFLLILDTYLMKDSGILLIDEYENSLGINAINFLPDLIHSISEKCQFIITSHHPYIINNIPIENWFVFHRNGKVVNIKNGKELKEKYKQSKQEQFIQLINDPFYAGGVE